MDLARGFFGSRARLSGVRPRGFLYEELLASKKSGWHLCQGRVYTADVEFRDRLIATLRAIEPVLNEPGVLVIGSEVPNLLESGAASTLIVSQDIDIGVPVGRHAAIKQRLPEMHGFRPSPEEPSVWLPEDPACIEVNFVGMDPDIEGAGETYVFEDAELPLLVFGNLSLLKPGRTVYVDTTRIPLPQIAGLALEKLITDRSNEKGERDLLVVLALLLVADESDWLELARIYRTLPPELRHAARANLTILSLMNPVAGMPDPRLHRAKITHVLRKLEAEEAERR